MKGRLYAEREGLDSRETGTESPVPGPIENAPWCRSAVLDSGDSVVGRVESPGEPGLEAVAPELRVESGAASTGTSGLASGPASTFSNVALFDVVATAASWDRVAAGVSGGECRVDARGLARCDGCADES